MWKQAVQKKRDTRDIMITEFRNTSSRPILLNITVDELECREKGAVHILCLCSASPWLQADAVQGSETQCLKWGQHTKAENIYQLPTVAVIQPTRVYKNPICRGPFAQKINCQPSRTDIFFYVFKANCIQGSLLGCRANIPQAHREEQEAGTSELPGAADVPYAVTDATYNVLGMPPI